MTEKIVQTGTWLYDGLIETPVDIIALEFDWWYELYKADDMLEADEKPMPLSADGCLYYVRFQHALQKIKPTSVDSPGHANLADALRYAENKVVGGIKWHK